ncbi:MAG: HIT domain-containing protein [Opitutae bacterium]|nr:HIT domain-containing protein [Opitutae bacterium]MBT6849692.1 HIT domain-containing protein [Opitutae bacterium]MBT7924275.1 HIT domain-containing protein [Opitutae bacterium]
MHNLHAYWRMQYLSVPSEGEEVGNPFVRLPEHGDDRAVYIVHRAKYSYLVLNKYPYNPGHLLAVPFREVPRLRDLGADERIDLMELITFAQDLLEDAFSPDGFNIGINEGSTGGAGIPGHMHAHVVPRWKSDTNFMPVLADTRVLPESLDATCEKLCDCVAARLG